VRPPLTNLSLHEQFALLDKAKRLPLLASL